MAKPKGPETRRNRPLGFATRAIHHGYDPAGEHGALTPPVFMTSTYVFDTVEDVAAIYRGEATGYTYGRTRNPTQALLEERVADLEGAEAGVAFASGMGAISSTLWTLLAAGDEAVVDTTLYGNTYTLFTQGMARFGVRVTHVDFGDQAALERALAGKPRVVYFETPANPNLRVIDIAAVARAAHKAGATVVVDNTFCSPALQRPVALGADVVLHSATKFLSGHGDLLAGIAVGPKAVVERIRLHGLRYLTGATIAPMTAFLVLRGLKTLELRMERHSSSALAIARHLAAHQRVASVAYPWLEDFPQSAVARRQMTQGGGLVSFELKGGLAAGLAFMNALKLAHRAVSLGDAETLVNHPASMTHGNYSPEERLAHGIADGLVRLSVGLESLPDLLDDLDQALERT